MKAKNYAIWAVIVLIVVIIGVCWSMNKAAQAPDQTAADTSGTTVTGGTPPTANAPMGTYPVHIPTKQSSVYSVYYSPINTSTSSTATSIEVNNPPANTVIASPLSVTGKARGSWYFEASFQVILTDANGKILAKTNATALNDWQTNDFVPFAGKLIFPAQTTGEKGVLILKKDNPSGLAANDASIEIQVTFK